MNERNSDTAAITAVAIASPLVSALVVLPIASIHDSVREASSRWMPAISKMP